MKKLLSLLCIVILMSSLAVCSLKFNGSRTGNDHGFLMEYDVLNKTDSQELKLQAGDRINAKITVDGGTLAIKIQKEAEPPLYERDGISASNAFAVEAEESGTYTVTVTGKHAKGSVDFAVVSAE